MFILFYPSKTELDERMHRRISILQARCGCQLLCNLSASWPTQSTAQVHKPHHYEQPCLLYVTSYNVVDSGGQPAAHGHKATTISYGIVYNHIQEVIHQVAGAARIAHVACSQCCVRYDHVVSLECSLVCRCSCCCAYLHILLTYDCLALKVLQDHPYIRTRGMAFCACNYVACSKLVECSAELTVKVLSTRQTIF